MSLQLKQSLKLPGASKIRGKEPPPPPPHPSSSPITTIDAKLLEGILAKGGKLVDLSSNAYNLESDDFFLHCPNVIKELDLSFNSLIQLSSLKNLHKLKRLFVDNNVLVSFPFHGLSNLVMLSAQNNRLVTIEDTNDMKKLVHLDLCGNRIVHGFEELGKLKTLRVLDLASNTLDMPIQNFTAFVLEPLKRLPKLEYVSFADNPVATKIPEFRCFVIQELPKLKYLDWLPITKEERVKAAKLESENIWSAKTQPPQDTPSPRVGSTTSITHNSSKDAAVEPPKSSPAAETPGVSTVPVAASPVRGLSPSASVSTPSPISRRAAPPVRESSQFNDFSALDAMIEEFEGASQELMLSRSVSSPVSSPAPASVTSPVNRSNSSFDAGIGNISDIPAAAAIPSGQEDPLAELLTEFESITPAAPHDSVSPVSPIQAPPRPTNSQFTAALAMTDVNYPDHSYERYPEDAQILSNIDKAIESTPGAKQKKFPTNVVRSDFPDAYFADELEAALGELEASLDFPESHDQPEHNDGNAPQNNYDNRMYTLRSLSEIDPTLNEVAGTSTPPAGNTPQNNYNNKSYTITSLSEIESTLQELASTTSTPSKSETSVENGSPYTTPTHNKNNDSGNLNTSRSSPYGANFSSNSNRTNTPAHNQPKPPVQRTQSDLPKNSPKLPTPPASATLKKPVSKPAASPSSNNASFSHSFAASFDSPSSPTASAVPDSPKIRSKHAAIPVVVEPVVESHPEETLQDEEDVLDELISSLALEGGQEDDGEPGVPTMLRPRRPLSAVFVHPVSQPALSTLPSPAQLPQSIIKQQELQQQQQMLLHQQERERRINAERQRQMQEEHDQQQLAMKQKLTQQQQQMELLQKQQADREQKLQEERERERLQREQLVYREQVLQRELQQQKELQIQKELQLQTEIRKKEMQAEALLQQQKQHALMLQQQAIAQKQQQDELAAEIEAARKAQQEEERARLINMTAQLVPYNFLTITDKIGGGAFGDVHKCVMRYSPTANLAPKDVTVKKIRMQRFNDNFLDQFSKEVQSFSALSPHPNIVPLIGGCIEVVICTIHDYVSGISLAETKGIRELGNSLTLQIARSIVAGLQELHKIGKMHRSLKPSNVMLANPDETTPLRTVKLRDYGFVAIKDAILKAGQAPTPYLAPELIVTTSPPSYTQAVDTFAFGMTMWFMFSGEQPFPGLHPKKMTESLASGVRPPIPPHTPTALAKLIAACWNTEPTARPPLDTVARILSMSEAKLFAGAAPIANPPPPQQPQPPQQPPQTPQPQPQSQSQPPPQTQSPQPPRQTRTTPLTEGQGARISTVLSRVVDTLISKAQNQIPKACRLLEVINQPDVIPGMVEKGIPRYLVDMLKNTQAESTDIEAVLRTLQILSDHEIFARSLCAPDMIAPILALVRPHTAVANISRSSYVVKNTYVLPAARVVHAIIAHSALLVVLRDSPDAETLVTFTDSLKDSQNQVSNQSNDEATSQMLGVLCLMLSTPKARNYFITASGLDAVLFHGNSSYSPLRAHVIEVLFLFTVYPPSPPTILQDGFVRNPTTVISLISCISSSTDMLQSRRQATKIIAFLAQLPWQSSGVPSAGGSNRSTSSAGSSRSGSLTNAAVTASLQAAVPKLISTVGSCKAGENDELVLDICSALSSILDNPNLNASGSISKLDQLAIFAQLQHIPQSSPILLPLLHLANRIVHLRSDDTANLHGELAMCVPQLISIACSPSLPLEVKTQALDFIAHIATDGQHALTLVEAGLVQPLMQQLTHSAKDPSTAFSLQILASILNSLFQDRSPSFASVCASIVTTNGIASISNFVHASKGTGTEHSDAENACEWAVAALSELSRDETTRTAMLSAGTLALLVDMGSQKDASDRVVEGALACLSSFCSSPKYYQPLKDSKGIVLIVSRLSATDNVVPLALKCVLQLVKEPAGREMLVANDAIGKLETLANTTEPKNPTLPLAAKKVLSLLKT